MPATSRTCTPMLLALALLMLACGGDVAPPAPTAPPPAGEGMPLLERRPLSLAPDDLPENRFSMFAVAGDGRLVYLASHSEAPMIRVVDSAGRRLAAFGRNGEGPGEWRLPIFIGVEGDTLRALDTGRAKLIKTRLDGTLVRERPALIGDVPLAWHADSVDHWQPPLPPSRNIDPVVIRSLIGERAGRTLLTADDSIFAAAIAKRGENPPLSFPFAATLDRFWVADPWDYRIRAFDANGVERFTVAPDVPRPRRGPAMADRVRAQLERRPKYTRGPNGEAIRLPDASARLDTLERERIPHFGRSSLQVDRHGRLWVLGRSMDSATVDVFRDATHLGRTMLPCLLTGTGTIASLAPGWLAVECDIEGSDWPTELQLYRIVER